MKLQYNLKSLQLYVTYWCVNLRATSSPYLPSLCSFFCLSVILSESPPLSVCLSLSLSVSLSLSLSLSLSSPLLLPPLPPSTSLPFSLAHNYTACQISKALVHSLGKLSPLLYTNIAFAALARPHPSSRSLLSCDPLVAMATMSLGILGSLESSDLMIASEAGLAVE